MPQDEQTPPEGAPSGNENEGAEQSVETPEIPSTASGLEQLFNQQRQQQNAEGEETPGSTQDSENLQELGTETPGEGGGSEDPPQDAGTPTEEEGQSGKQEEGEDDVLSKRAEKRIKSLLERLDQKDQELEKLKSGNQQQDDQALSMADRVARANSPEELTQLYKTAKSAVSWARRNLHKDYVEVDGEEKSHDDIVAIMESAEETLNELIPQRVQTLQQRAKAEQLVEQKFPGWKDPESEEGQWFQNALKDPTAQKLLNEFPNGKMMLGYIYKGVKAEEAEQKQSQQQGNQQGKQQGQPATPPKKETKQAPNLPGMGAAAAKNKIEPSAEQKQKQLTGQLEGKESLSKDELESFFNQQAQLRQ